MPNTTDWVAVLVPAISGLVGAGIGGWLTVLSTNRTIKKNIEAAQQQHQWESAEQARADTTRRQNIRTLLRIENAINLDELEMFWQRVMNIPVDGALAFSIVEEQYIRHSRLVTEPLKPWGHLMWQSQTADLAMALSEDEVQACYALHTQLEHFNALRAQLREVYVSEGAQSLAGAYTGWRFKASLALRQGQTPIPSFERGAEIEVYSELTRYLWNGCEAIYNHLQHAGNPLPP